MVALNYEYVYEIVVVGDQVYYFTHHLEKTVNLIEIGSVNFLFFEHSQAPIDANSQSPLLYHVSRVVIGQISYQSDKAADIIVR